MSGPWAGRSLSYIRQVLGQGPFYVLTIEAMEDSGPLTNADPPPVGTLCWYATDHPYGNVTLCIGAPSASDVPQVLCVSDGGWPTVKRFNDEHHGRYLGWTKTLGRD